VIPDVDSDDRRFMILMHDESKTVIQNELLVRDIDVEALGHGGSCHGQD
jgi:hypothetical protein